MTVRPLPVPARFSFGYSPPTVEDAVALLRTGRAHMALWVLDRLPARIEEERRAAEPRLFVQQATLREQGPSLS